MFEINETKEKIRTQPQSFCYLCSGPAKTIYSGLKDKIFAVWGEWNFKLCQNRDCGLLWLDPMPVKEDIGKTYLDYYTHSQTDKVSKSFSRGLIDFIKTGYLNRKYNYNSDSLNFWQKIFGLLIYLDPGLKSEIDSEVMYLKSKPKGLLLDVGCGNGKFLGLMRELGWQVEGTEIDPKAVEIARNNKLQVGAGELAEQRYPVNSFDVITLNSVIEHVQDPLNLLKESCRILKDGGVLMILTPNTESRTHRIYKDKWLNLDPPRHLHLFSPKNLRSLAGKAGFKNVSVWTTSRNLRSSLLGSWDFESKGCHQMGGWQPWSRRILAKILQLIEEIILRIKKNIGDEIILKAQK